MPGLEAVFRINDRYTSAINKIMASTATAENKIKAISNTTYIFNRELSQIKTGASLGAAGITSLVGALKGLAAAYLTVQAAKKGMEISDNYTNTAARLNLINDGTQTTAELQEKIFNAAQRSRGAYNDMASAVAKMGLLAKESFNSNDELIAFTELVQKSFKIGGASAQEQQAGLYQLTQAMAAGKLQGDEFRSIMENAPMIADAIAKFTGKSKGELKKMSADGVITADVIKNAMFKVSGDINKMFDKMPRTFADIFTDVNNRAQKAFKPVIEKISNLINRPEFLIFADKITAGFNLAAIAAGWVVDVIDRLIVAIQLAWKIIEPVIVLVSSALAAWVLTKIPLLITGIKKMAVETWKAIIPWIVANWQILLIGAAIGFIIYSMIKFGDTTAEVFGYIGGVIGAFVAYMYNSFAYIANFLYAFGEFFVNIWIDPIYAVKKLFYDLMINALSYITNIAKAIENVINSIPGVKVNITGAMSNILNTLQNQQASLKSDKNVIKFQRFEQMDYTSAFNIGKDIGKRAGNSALNWMQGTFNKLTNAISPKLAGADIPGIGEYMKNGALPVTGKVDISEEDLKYIKDIAEREYINKYTTAALAPNIKITFTGPITKEADADKVAGRIAKMMKEEIAMLAEGSYA